MYPVDFCCTFLSFLFFILVNITYSSVPSEFFEIESLNRFSLVYFIFIHSLFSYGDDKMFKYEGVVENLRIYKDKLLVISLNKSLDDSTIKFCRQAYNIDCVNILDCNFTSIRSGLVSKIILLRYNIV